LGGRVLRSLTDGGMQYLIAGARADVGAKAGRYMYEVKILEALPIYDHAWGRNAPKPKQLCRVGFSAAGSGLVLGADEEHVYFDTKGFFWAEKKKNKVAQPWGKDVVVAVVLNLDPASPNANTVSLFRDGVRFTQPQPLPECLKGKALFPHVAFRNVTVQVHLGAEPLRALEPFSCRTIGGAAAADVKVEKGAAPKDGKFDVMFPVAYPDEGTFDWLDSFIKENPSYTELSDRKVLEWAHASGVWKPSKGWRQGQGSADKPEFAHGLHELDNFSVRRILAALTPSVPRNYVVMEVKANLVAKDRKDFLARFSGPTFKRTACVVMGEPDAEFKQAQQAKILKAKQAKATHKWQVEKAEKVRKKAAAEKAKKLADAMKKAEQERHLKKEAEAKKEAEKAEVAKKEEDVKEEDKKPEEGAAGGAKAKDEEEKKEATSEEKKEDEIKTESEGKVAKEEQAEDKKEEGMEVEEGDDDQEPPTVELSEEEQALWFAPKMPNDLSNKAFAEYVDFSLPEKSEGFEDVRYVWSQAAGAKEYLRKKVLERKRTSLVDNLNPSQWFHDKVAEWKKLFAEWQKKQEDFKASPEQVAKEAAKKAAADKKDGEGNDELSDEKPKGDLFSVEDICDIGEGEPVFKDFGIADWALLQLRFELYLLQVAFRKDVDDPDRPGISEQYFAFYYQKYYKKQLLYMNYGCENLRDVCKLVKDTAVWKEDILSTPITKAAEDEMTYFVKLSEEHRRERQRRLDAGDETARLKISPAALAPPKAIVAATAVGGVTPPPPAAAQAGITALGDVPGAEGAAKGGGKPQWAQAQKGGFAAAGVPAPPPPAWGGGGAARWGGGQQAQWGKGGKGGGKGGKRW